MSNQDFDLIPVDTVGYECQCGEQFNMTGPRPQVQPLADKWMFDHRKHDPDYDPEFDDAEADDGELAALGYYEWQYGEADD